MPMTPSSFFFSFFFLLPSFDQSVYQPFSCPSFELRIATRTFEIWLQPDRPREPPNVTMSARNETQSLLPPCRTVSATTLQRVLYTGIKLLYVFPPSLLHARVFFTRLIDSTAPSHVLLFTFLNRNRQHNFFDDRETFKYIIVIVIYDIKI